MGVETRRLVKAKKNSPPIFSHEFVIQNHGDITSVILMLVFGAFMFPSTSGFANVFVLPQYNETVNGTVPGSGIPFSYEAWRVGVRDVFTVLFYAVACVTVHAIIQEYLIDKLVRRACRDSKLTISKTKMVKLNESGQLLCFYVFTIANAVFVLYETFNQFTDLPKLWTNYPAEHRLLTLRAKYFFIAQLAYWVHQLPEFYLQKYKGEEMRARTPAILIHIGVIAAAYAMNFHRLATVIIAVEALVGLVFHFARIFHILERKNNANTLFRIWNVLFLISRLVETLLSVMVFWHGLKHSEQPFVNVEEGNFNTSFVRLNCLLVILVLQGYQVVNFVSFHVGRMRDSWQKKAKKSQQSAAVAAGKKDKKKKDQEEEGDKKTN